MQRFPDGGGRRQVSTGGGIQPKWSDGGRTLTYLRAPAGPPDTVMVEGGGTPEAPLVLSAPTELFPWAYYQARGLNLTYDLRPDGDRMVMLKRGDADEAPDDAPGIVVVQNWDQKLKRLVPVE